MESLNIPTKLKKIGRSAFTYCGKLSSPITIPESVTKIQDYTFMDCFSLKEITLHDKVTSIGAYAFYDCQKISDFGSSLLSLDSIGPVAFYRCTKLNKAYLPSKMTVIPEYAYYGCKSIKSVDLSGKEIIGKYAFYGCSGLTTIPMSDNLRSIGAYAFANSGLSGELSLPRSVKDVAYGAFCKTDVSSVMINSDIALGERPDVTIVSDPFSYCNKLTTVTIAEGCSMFELSFSGCKSLTKVVLPSTLESIGIKDDYTTLLHPGGIFQGCTSLESISLPLALKTIGASAFKGCSGLQAITLPPDLKTIQSSAFSGCTSLSMIVIPRHVEELGAYIFNGCTSLENVQFEMTITEIPQGLFENCTSLKSFVCPSTITAIGYESFKGSGIVDIELPENIKFIENMAFMNCESLQKISLPSSLKEIASNAFSGCTSLRNVAFANECQLLSIGNASFYHCTSLSSIVLPSALQKIGDSAFDTSGLNDITIPASVETIEENCFANCRRLQKVTTPFYTTYGLSSQYFLTGNGRSFGKL